MSESADYYMSWLGCNSFGTKTSVSITISPPILFQPTDLSDCSIWLDANDPTTITDISGVVSSWSNKGLAGGSANKNDGSVYTNTHTINGLNVMDFSPYSDLLLNWTQTVNPITVFIVMKPITDLTTTANPYINFFDAFSGAANFGTSMYYDSGLTQFGYGLGANNLAIYVMGYNSTNPTNLPLLISMRNNTTSDNQLILNNSIQTLTYTDNANYNLSNFTYYMGNPVHGTEFDFAEFIIYQRALSDAEIGLVNTYLTAKWDINTL